MGEGDKMMQVQRARDETFEVAIYDEDGNFIELGSSDYIAFDVKKYEGQTSSVISTELTSSDINTSQDGYIMELSRNDTNVNSGYYHYDIAVMLDDKLIPVIKWDDFVVGKASYEVSET